MKEDTVDLISESFFRVAFFALLLTPAIWGYQIYHWLRWGQWQSISIADGLDWIGAGTPIFAWDAVQNVSDLLLRAPLSITIFLVVIGGLFAFIGWTDRRLQAELREADLQKPGAG